MKGRRRREMKAGIVGDIGGVRELGLLCEWLGEVVRRVLFMRFVVEGLADDGGVETRAGKIEQTPR